MGNSVRVTFEALMLFDPQGDKLGILSLGGVAASWPNVTLEKCAG
jgi:hypothetical protein